MIAPRQQGFTLLEVMLAIMIFASSALLVVMTIPDRSGPGVFGQQFKTLLEYASTRAVMEGNIIGMVITDREFLLVELNHNEVATDLASVRCRTCHHAGGFPGKLAGRTGSPAPCRITGVAAAGPVFTRWRDQRLYAVAQCQRRAAKL